jgi:murein DD-endopeptidase MepM/ murein hydrolase activator NlpD
MRSLRVRCGWVGRTVALLSFLFIFAACSSTATVAVAPSPSFEDDDFSQLIGQLSADLHRHNARVAPQAAAATPSTAATRRERDRQFAERANALFSTLNGTSLYMPVVGIKSYHLTNSWHASRDGGKRKHKGIDIFAPKGTPVVAVSDGIISYIGIQPKGGQCLWLTNEDGASFYYAHLDRWAPGLFEGMEVRSGDLLGYVGNTGNARTTPPHLHFGVNQNDEMVNPYPILTRANPVQRARSAVDSGAGVMGTR